MTKKKDKPASEVTKWLGHIAVYDRKFDAWVNRVDKIIRRYRDEGRKTSDQQVRFNILWSNVQTLVPATFSRTPQPDVSRRFRDNDPVGRVASLLLERGLDFEIQHYPDYRITMKECVQDRFLGGRGTAWARYEPHIRALAVQQPVDGAEVTEDVDEANEELEYECAPTDYVHWRDFGHIVARTWEEVPAVWRWVYMDREACIARFGEEKGNKIPLDARPREAQRDDDMGGEREDARAKICEIWDKTSNEALWLSKSLGEVLDRRSAGTEDGDVPKFEGFFPCPRPLFATMTNDTLVPVPDFILYQDQANELDTLSDRIDGLIKALQVKGVYDASVPELARIFTEGGNTQLIPVKSWQAFAEKNGLQGAIDLVDLKPIYEALKAAYEAFAEVIQFIYQITGISDIVRGETDPNETLGAQQLKGQYASLRLKDMQTQTAQFASELLQLKAQIICLKFDPQTILKISSADQLSDADKPYVMDAIALLKGGANGEANPLRSFRIEVNADTLVQFDENAEKQNATEFLTAIGAYLEKAAQVGQMAPQVVPLVLELLKWGVSRFKVGKSIEGAIDQALDQFKQELAQPKPPSPDPAMEKVKADAAANQQKMPAEQQLEQQRMQFEQQKAAMETGLEQQRAQLEAALERQRADAEHQRALLQAQVDDRFQRWKAELEVKGKIEVAEISADASLDAAQITAAKQGTEE